MSYKTTALALLGAVFIMPSAAQAGGHSVDKFMEADTNGNSLVSKEEYLAVKEAKFMKIDSNADGSVSVDEYEAYTHAKMGKKKRAKHMHDEHSHNNGDKE